MEAVIGWGEGGVIVTEHGQVRIDRMDMWKVEVRRKLEPAIEEAKRNAVRNAEGKETTLFLKK